MKYFLDTEFIESGPHAPIDLISIGIVCEDGREYYAVSAEFNACDASSWVMENVFPTIENTPRKYLSTIADELVYFVRQSEKDRPEFWGYYADYDWVVLCQIFGRMIELPKGWPMFCRDIKQLAMELGNPKLPEQLTTEHNALNDAKWNKDAWEFLMIYEKRLEGLG